MRTVEAGTAGTSGTAILTTYYVAVQKFWAVCRKNADVYAGPAPQPSSRVCGY